MMRADHLIHGEIAEPQPSPGFLLARLAGQQNRWPQ
jgi:hypothetical protein